MIGVNNPNIVRLSPSDKHFFYGYYDNKQISDDGSRYLFHHVDFMDRLPVANDVCRLGFIDVKTGEINYFGKTLAWNFQQGCMLEWDPARKDSVYYNYFDGIDYRACRHNIKTGEKQDLPRANADISPNGKYGLSINFSRMYDFRPGYGYCNVEDPFQDEVAPEDDGIFLIDLENADTHLLVSYKALYEIFNSSEDTKDCKVVINHITFNAESDRFLFLIRCFPHGEKEWKTGLGTCDLEGNVYLLRDYTFASHYFWKEKGILLIYADCGEGKGLYELKDMSQSYQLYPKSFFDQDIHCTYSPNRQWIAGDGYPENDGYRPMFLYNMIEKKGLLALQAYSPTGECTDIRCDLHSKWTPDGKNLVFDSIHEGFRGIYSVDLTSEMETIINK
jgi:hypothetical protein